MSNDEKKILNDLPPKKPAKDADDPSRPIAAKDADAVKGGAKAQGYNHNQTVRARRATHS